MSISVSQRVWKNSTQRGSLKLLLLALADFADDTGICWPRVSTLADLIGEDQHYTRKLLKKLLLAGEIITSPGGGRGNITRYGITVGLNNHQLQVLSKRIENSELKNSVLENTELEGTVSSPENSVLQSQKTVDSETLFSETLFSSPENSVLQSQKTVYYSPASEVSNTALQSIETAQIEREIRHVDPSCDPPEMESTKKPRSRASRKRDSATSLSKNEQTESTPIEIRQAIAEVCDIDISPGSRPPQKMIVALNNEAKLLWQQQQLRHISIEATVAGVQATASYTRKMDKRFADPNTRLPVGIIRENWTAAGRWKRQQKTYTNGANGMHGLNGVPATNGYHAPPETFNTPETMAEKLLKLQAKREAAAKEAV